MNCAEISISVYILLQKCPAKNSKVCLGFLKKQNNNKSCFFRMIEA